MIPSLLRKLFTRWKRKERRVRDFFFFKLLFIYLFFLLTRSRVRINWHRAQILNTTPRIAVINVIFFISETARSRSGDDCSTFIQKRRALGLISPGGNFELFSKEEV